MQQHNIFYFHFRQLRNSYLLKAALIVILGLIACAVHSHCHHRKSYWILLVAGLFLTMCAMSVRTLLYSRALAKH